MRFRLVPALLLAVFLAGCSSQKNKQESTAVIDDLQRRIEFHEVPQRLVSLAPSITECLYALGVDSLLQGVTSVCNYPPSAKTKTIVGGMYTPDMERIISLKPDLVLLTVEGNTRQTNDKLETLGIRTFVSNPRSLDGILKAIKDLGALCGAYERAATVADSLSRIRRRIASDTAGKHPKIVMLVSVEPLMVAGNDSFLGEYLSLAGADNLGRFFRGSYPTIGREELIRVNPDMILLPADMGMSRAELLDRFPEWRLITAIRDDFIITVDGDVFLRPGPRAFQALELLHRLVKLGDTKKGQRTVRRPS